jgi:hypothetical protein
MTTLRIAAVAIAAGWMVALVSPGAALAFDLKACMAKCKDQRCKENCEVQANNDMNQRTRNDNCWGVEDPKTHVISFPNCK